MRKIKLIYFFMITVFLSLSLIGGLHLGVKLYYHLPILGNTESYKEIYDAKAESILLNSFQRYQDQQAFEGENIVEGGYKLSVDQINLVIPRYYYENNIYEIVDKQQEKQSLKEDIKLLDGSSAREGIQDSNQIFDIQSAYVAQLGSYQNVKTVSDMDSLLSDPTKELTEVEKKNAYTIIIENGKIILEGFDVQHESRIKEYLSSVLSHHKTLQFQSRVILTDEVVSNLPDITAKLDLMKQIQSSSISVVFILLIVPGIYELYCYTQEIGRLDYDQLSKPNFIDRIPVEIMIVLMGIGLSSLYLADMTLLKFLFDRYIMDGYYIQYHPLLVSLLFALMVNIVILLGLYTLLVRKMKLTSIWKESLLGKGCQWIKKISQFETSQKRILFWLGCILILGIGFTFISHSLVPLIIMSVAMIWMFVRLIKDIDIIQKGIKIQGQYTSLNLKEISIMNQPLAQEINNLSSTVEQAVSEKFKSEKLKTDLITNVSHDLKTPLTAIITYLGLIQREKIENPTIQEYLEIIQEKAQRLKILTEDIVEASKVSSGSIQLTIQPLNLHELVSQILGEYESQYQEKNLSIEYTQDDQMSDILADSQAMYRVLDNLFSNIYKYSLEGTRVYVELKGSQLILKNISKHKMNVAVDELLERFVQGDESRQQQGSGLGLAIASDLVKLQEGTLQIEIDGDLFKTILALKKAQ